MPEQTAEEKAKMINAAITAADAKRRADDAKENNGQQLDKLLSSLGKLTDTLGGIVKRIDALEKAGAEPGDGKHLPRHVGKDGDDDGDGDGKHGKQLGPEDNEDARRVVADDAGYGSGKLSTATRIAFADVQARCDSAARCWGGAAPPPMQGELLRDYRVRCLRPMQRYSAEFQKVDLDKLDGGALLDAIEGHVYSDAISASSNPAYAPEGTLREVRRKDTTGREIIEWHGEPKLWLAQFAGARRRVIGIRNTSTV